MDNKKPEEKRVCRRCDRSGTGIYWYSKSLCEDCYDKRAKQIFYPLICFGIGMFFIIVANALVYPQLYGNGMGIVMSHGLGGGANTRISCLTYSTPNDNTTIYKGCVGNVAGKDFKINITRTP